MDDSEARTVAVVTGGAGGMGLATAKLLGREHHVVVADVRGDRLDAAVEELAGAGVESDAVVCDVTDRAAVRALAAMAASRGTVVSVVHTAGLSPRMAPAEQILRVNVLGTVLVDRAFEPYAGHGSCIVNVASTAGHLPPLLPTPSRTYRLALSDPDRFLDRMVARCARATPGTCGHGVRAQQALRDLVVPAAGGPARRQGRPHPVGVAGFVRHRDGAAGGAQRRR